MQSIVWWWMCVSFCVGINANIIPGLQERKLRFKEIIVNKLVSKVRFTSRILWLQRLYSWTPLSFVGEYVFIDLPSFWVSSPEFVLHPRIYMYFQSREFHVVTTPAGAFFSGHWCVISVVKLCARHLTLCRVCLVSVPLILSVLSLKFVWIFVSFRYMYRH